MINWEKKKLGEVCVVERGSSPRPIQKYQTDSPDGVNWIKIGDTKGVEKYIFSTREKITKEGAEKSRYVKEGDFILSNSMSFGKPYIMKTDGYIHDGWFVFRLPDYLDKDYFYHLLTSPNVQEQIQSLGAGAIVKNISGDLVKKVDITFPKSLQEQQRIVAILDEAFAAIAKAKAKAEQNLKNANELFESYLQGVFENPKDNWDKKKWGDLCHFVRGPFGGSLKKSIFKEEGYVVYEQKHAIHDHFNQLRYFIDEDKFNEMIRFELKAGDIIMSCSGVTLGRVAIVPEGIKRGIINQALLKLTPKKNVSVHFIKHWLRSRIFQKIIFEFAGGAAIPNVPSAKILKDILIPFPTLQEQEKVVNDIELMLAESQKLEVIYQKKINDLEELKKSVLQKAFSGELIEKK